MKIVNEQIESTLENFGLELQRELEADEEFRKMAIETFRAVAKEGLNNAAKEAKNGSPNKNAQDGEENIRIDEGICFDICNAIIDSYLNACDTWVETGNFKDLAPKLEFEDINKLLKEINIFDIINDIRETKNSKEIYEKRFENKETSLPQRIVIAFLYYLAFNLPEEKLDNCIDSATGKISKNFFDNAQDALKPFYQKVISIIQDYLADQAISMTANMKGLSEEFKDKLHKKADTLNLIANTMGVISDISKKAFNVGDDIVKFANEVQNSKTGEDSISYLAQEVLIAKRLSESAHNNFLIKLAPYENNFEQMPIEQVIQCVSYMWGGLHNDVSGTNAYLNVVTKGNAESDEKGENSLFIRLLNGGKHGFIIGQGAITYDYRNVNGQVGLLNVTTANRMRTIVSNWENWSREGWKDEWLQLTGD